LCRGGGVGVRGRGAAAGGVSVLLFVFVVMHYIISCLFVWRQLLYECVACLVWCEMDGSMCGRLCLDLITMYVLYIVV
jgi:hypothetical protein